MSFGGLVLTNAGRNKIAGAVSEDNALNFNSVKLGDGVYSGSLTSKQELSNEVMEIPITNVVRNENEVIIDCDWDSKNAPHGFYLREIGIIGNGVLCYYDNAGAGDAEYIDPQSEVVTKQKRLRFVLVISSEVNITTQINSGLYALSEEVNNQVAALIKKVEDLTQDDIGLDKVDNTADAEKSVKYATDADTVDGKHAEELQNYNNLINKPSVFQAPNTSGEGAKPGLVPAPTVADIPKILSGGGSWVPANGHNHDDYAVVGHTHTADDVGALPQNGTAAKTNAFHVSRVLKNPSYSPGMYTAVLEEFQSNSEGLPSNHYYHILTSQGGDSNYEIQLAIGMTVDDMFFRNRKAGAWGSWIKLMHSGNAIPKSGGTFTGAIGVGTKVKLWTDGEGGNIQIDSPDSYNKEWQMDAFNGNLRIYQTDKSTKSNYFPLSLTKDTLVANKITANGGIEGTSSAATKLTTSAGSVDVPVYFSGGKPVKCRCYSPGYGDSFQWWGSGVLTNGNRSIYFTVTLGKPVSENVSGATLQNASMVLRQNGQYLKGNGNTVCTTGFNIELQLKKFNMLTMIITFDTSIGGINNDCIGVLLEGNLYFT